MTRLIHADTLLPGDAPPIADGAVVVATSDEAAALPGTVLDVGPASELAARHAGAEVVRVRGVVFPGLVNAHTHVELSAMRGKVAGGRGFVAWVEGLIGLRAEVQPEDDLAEIDAGVQALVRTGTVALGEVTNSLAAVPAALRAGLAGCVFHEVFGLAPAVVESKLATAARQFEATRAAMLELGLGAWPSSDLAYAPAPHTLYTTHSDAVRELLRRARALGARSSLHLAEHPAERRFVEHGDGPVAEWYRRAGLPLSAVGPHRPLLDLADELGALAGDVLLVHLTDARREELARIAERGAPVVLCPRSNLHIEMRLPPLGEMRAAGIAPALGTDSLASSPSLDVLGEAKALRDRFRDVPAWELVQMATWNGARALGRPDLGRLARGARPGVVAVELDACGADAAAALLDDVRLPRRMLVTRSGILDGEARGARTSPETSL